MLPLHSFGYWLRLKRKAHDLTREELASRVGCSAATIRKLEAEERRPSAQMAERLAEVFNIPAGERQSFLSFTRGDWTSAPGDSAETAPWRTTNLTSLSNLPFPTTSLIGREKEIAEVSGYLTKADIRLVNLIGPPGIGKTRLSIESARSVLSHFPDGAFFAALAALDDPSLLAPAILQALGYKESSGLHADQQLRYGIGDKRILIVLDNCEHLIDAVSLVVSGLLSACPHLKILITSREALRIPGEWLYSVPVLETPKENSPISLDNAFAFPALTLFSERARAVRSDFNLTAGNLQAVASICRQLDGLPLAIELMAARIRLMAPELLRERMNDQFVLSADGMRAVSARQKTLNNAIGWSYNVLPSEEQELFASLSVFLGGFTLQAAEAIFSKSFTGKSVSDLITSLLDKSLLQRSIDSSGGVRFNMLVTIRQFALIHLRGLGIEEDVRSEHLAYFLDQAEQGDKEIHGPAQIAWGDRLESERDNFRTALDWAVSTQKTELALRLLCALGWPWEVRGHYKEARAWYEKIRVLPNVSHYPLIHAQLLNHIGRQSWLQEQYGDATSLLGESQAITLRLGTSGELCLADTLNWLSLVAYYKDRDRKTAQTLLERGLSLFQKWDDQRGVALSTFHLGLVQGDQNDDTALSLFERSMSLFQQFGDQFFIARVSLFLGYIYLRKRNYDRARLFFEQQLNLDIELKNWDGISDGWRELGDLARREEKYDQAEKYYDESVTVGNEHGLMKAEANYFSGLLAMHRGDYHKAFQRFTYLLDQIQKSERYTNMCFTLAGLAAVVGWNHQPERAAKLFGAAQACLETAGDETLPLEQAEYNRHMQLVREQIGDARFEALQAEGRAMTIQQAVAFALEGRGFQETLAH